MTYAQEQTGPSPAEIANDMAAHARYWNGRDKHIASTCHMAEAQLRNLIAKNPIDYRSWNALHRRLCSFEGRGSNLKAMPNFTRARLTLERLKKEAT